MRACLPSSASALARRAPVSLRWRRPALGLALALAALGGASGFASAQSPPPAAAPAATTPARPVVTIGPSKPAPERLAPGENLVALNIPDVPQELAQRVARFTEFRAAALADWHPKRREMLINTRFGETPQIHLVKAPGGARRQLTFFSDRVGGARFQPQKGEYFIFTKDIGGGEFFQLYRQDLGDKASGEAVLLTDGKSRNTGGEFSRSGARLAYNSTRRNGKDTDFYVMDPRDPKTDRLVAKVNGGGWEVLDWSPDEKTLLVEEQISANESYFWLLAVESGKLTPLTARGGADPLVAPTPVPESDRVAYRQAQFSTDGKSVYLTSDRESEFQRLAVLDLATQKVEYLTTAIKWDVDSFELSRDGRTIALVTNEDGVGVLQLMDTRTRKLTRPKLPAGSVGGVRWHEDNHTLGFSLVTARSPLDVYALDTRTGKAERWTESESAVATADLPEPQLIRWKSFDGREISAFYYKPPTRFTGPRPVIVNIHGGPESQYRPGYLGRNNYFLTELGAAMIFPNVRGSSGYGKSYLKLDNGERREDSVKDIGALLDYIKAQPDLDAGRVMITGGSYGGYMTLAASVHFSDRIACSLDVVGISNFVTFLERTESYRRDLRRVEYGDERDPKMRALLQRISPLTSADKIRKPLFVVQGKNDPRVPAGEAEQIVDTLKRSNTPVWYLLAKDEGHGFAKKKNADFQFYATVLFIKKYLLK